jgi:hypothetical protein
MRVSFPLFLTAAYFSPRRRAPIDADRVVHDRFGAYSIPVSVVIDRSGIVADRVPEPHTEENLLPVLGRAGFKARRASVGDHIFR